MTAARRTAVLALHYQNDVVHRDGKIRLGLAADDAQRGIVLDAAERLFAAARAAGVPIVHVRIAFRADHADVLRNGPIWNNVFWRRRGADLGRGVPRSPAAATQ